ncbi:MAG: hypothetical protein HYV28_04900 [Ignavibacteriales bacterium]|nr:hypothetical protein [Ignavibacteriales bacterium]
MKEVYNSPQQVLSDSDKTKYSIHEYAIHHINKRGNFDNAAYGAGLLEPECWRSIYWHTKSVKEYHKQHNSVGGYADSVYAPYMLFATKRDMTLGDAINNVRKFILYMESQFELDRKYLSFMYDGESRIYIVFREELFGGFSPGKELPLIHNTIKSQLSQGGFQKVFDFDVYSHVAMMPMVNTYRTKTKLFAIMLTAEEVMSTEEKIKNLACSQRRIEPEIPNTELPELLKDLKEKAKIATYRSKEFLELLFGEKPQGVVEIRLITRFSSPRYTDSIKTAISIAQGASGQQNVYYGLATRIDKSSGEKVNCKELRVVYADIDYGKAGHKRKPKYETKEEVETVIKNCKLPPTIAVSSGHGYQLLWKLDQPYELGSAGNDRIERLMRKLGEHLGGDPVQNVDRIFRMPYTLNIKEEPFVESSIESMNPERVYSIKELEEWVGTETAKKAPAATSAGEPEEGELPLKILDSIKENCSWLQGVYAKVESEAHMEHENRIAFANLLSRFQGGSDEIHRTLAKCTDYKQEYTDYQLKSLKKIPPLCEKLCKEKCAAMKAIDKNSPIAFVYQNKEKDKTAAAKSGLDLNIVVEDGVYQTVHKTKTGYNYTPLTSFVIRPKVLLELEDSDCLTCEVITEAGVHYENILIENSDWHTKSRLLKAIGHQDCVFLGSDTNVQSICYMVNQEVPVRKKGSKLIGLCGDVWVVKDMNITKTGPAETLSIVPISKGGDSFIHKIGYEQNADYNSFVREFYDRITRINDNRVILPWLGWLFTTPLKPILTKLAGGFPILFVHGAQGTGKTSTASQMMRLSGYKELQTTSCTLRPFPLLKLLSSTNAIPVYLDEFKVSDMSTDQVEILLRYMRKNYSGEVESKGRADQTTEDYTLTAPMAVMGEWGVDQPAIKERVLMIRFSNAAKTNSGYQEAFKNLKRLPLESFMPKYIEFILGVDITSIFKEAETEVENHFSGISIAPRVKSNLTIMVTGLKLFELFGEKLGCKALGMNLGELLNDQLSEITGTTTGQVKSAVDQLIEELSIMAQSGRNIQNNRQFKLMEMDGPDGKRIKVIALKFNEVYPTFKEYAFKTKYEGDRLDKSSYMRLFDDTDYIVDKNRTVRFSNQTNRCICIDIQKAELAGLNLEGFVKIPDEPKRENPFEDVTPVTPCYTKNVTDILSK